TKNNPIDQVRELQECSILLFAEGSPNHLQTLSQGLMADGYIEKILDAEHVLTKAQAHLANQAHSFPEGMSHSSCQLEIGAFSKRMSDTHKFVRKRSQTSPSLGLCREENTQSHNELLESSSSSL
ncbi:MAG: hypothetical protein P1V97_34490, partial [Planctomycetota bacterium]|nr:hypothetical protein [Planctomycetota bacterium]